MATIITGIESSKVLSNLDTYNHTTKAAGMYQVSVSVSEQPPSGMSIVIQQNGSQKAASAAPAASQGVVMLSVPLNCALGDVISVILSSSVASDKAINQIKGILNIHQGPY